MRSVHDCTRCFLLESNTASLSPARSICNRFGDDGSAPSWNDVTLDAALVFNDSGGGRATTVDELCVRLAPEKRARDRTLGEGVGGASSRPPDDDTTTLGVVVTVADRFSIISARSDAVDENEARDETGAESDGRTNASLSLVADGVATMATADVAVLERRRARVDVARRIVGLRRSAKTSYLGRQLE